jgi:hypothetical protein
LWSVQWSACYGRCHLGFNYIFLQNLFFFFFSRRYNPWWVLACFTICSTIFYLYTSLSSFSLLSSLILFYSVKPTQSWSSYWSWWAWFPFSYFFNNSCCVHSDYMCCPS